MRRRKRPNEIVLRPQWCVERPEVRCAEHLALLDWILCKRQRAPIRRLARNRTILRSRRLQPLLEVSHELGTLRQTIHRDVPPRRCLVLKTRLTSTHDARTAELRWVGRLYAAAVFEVWVEPEEEVVDPGRSRSADVGR